MMRSLLLLLAVVLLVATDFNTSFHQSQISTKPIDVPVVADCQDCPPPCPPEGYDEITGAGRYENGKFAICNSLEISGPLETLVIHNSLVFIKGVEESNEEDDGDSVQIDVVEGARLVASKTLFSTFGSGSSAWAGIVLRGLEKDNGNTNCGSLDEVTIEFAGYRRVESNSFPEGALAITACGGATRMNRVTIRSSFDEGLYIRGDTKGGLGAVKKLLFTDLTVVGTQGEGVEVQGANPNDDSDVDVDVMFVNPVVINWGLEADDFDDECYEIDDADVFLCNPLCLRTTDKEVGKFIKADRDSIVRIAGGNLRYDDSIIKDEFTSTGKYRFYEKCPSVQNNNGGQFTEFQDDE